MGIFQKNISLEKVKINVIGLDKCSIKLQSSIETLNRTICSEQCNEDSYIKIFDLFCTLFIQNKAELKLNPFIKLMILKNMKYFVLESKNELLLSSMGYLSQQFIQNNILEDYRPEEIKALYIFTYLEVNDLVMPLAAQDRFKYEHDVNLEVTSEVLYLSKDIKILLPAQKLSLFYTQYKKELLNHLIQPDYKFNHVYQNINFLIKYLINSYANHLTGKKAVHI